MLGYSVEGFVVTWMASRGGVMVFLEDAEAKVAVLGNTDAVFKVPQVFTEVEEGGAARVFREVQGIISIGRGDVREEGVVGDNFSGREQVSEAEEEISGGGIGGEGRNIDVEEAGEGVGLVEVARAVLDGHVGLEGSEGLGPAGLALGEVTLSEEKAEGMVVSVESEVLAAVEVVAEFDTCVDDSSELLFMHCVVELSRVELAGFVAHRLGTTALILEEDSTNAFARGISVEFEGSIRAGEGNNEDRGGGEGSFEGMEGVDGVTGKRRGKRGGGLGEGGESSSEFGVIFDEAAVKASEAQEGTGGVQVMGKGPVSDCSYLAGVDCKSS